MRRACIALVVLAALLLVACERDDVPTVDRKTEAVVLTGAQLPTLQGVPPGQIVAFKFVYGQWQQVPAQVDERAVLDLNKPKNGSATGKTALFYTDANTWTGADPNVNFDADDELAFLVRDAFGKARSINEDGVNYTLGNPAHVVPGSGVRVQLDDSLGSDEQSWLYLFRSDGTLAPGAGRNDIQYTFNLLPANANYKANYKIAAGPNPEDSRVTTPYYTAHFSDRWIEDEVKIKAGNANQVDVLDRHKSGFAGNCGRSEDTFKTGAGAMIANKSGPVRAIRSYLGANSGTFTQRDHLMYESAMDTTTYLRVHEIPPLRDWYDYTTAATGMTFSASNVSGVPIDGVLDTVPTVLPTWQMVSGPQGTLVHTLRSETNIPNAIANTQQFYRDDSTPSETQCTGDAVEWGASGNQLNMTVPCTDPATNCTNFLITTRRVTYLPPDTTATTANDLAQQTATPLQATTSAFAP